MDISLSVSIQPSWHEICESWQQIDTQIRLFKVYQKIEFVLPEDAIEQYMQQVFESKYSALQQMEVYEQKTALLVMWLWRKDLQVSNTHVIVQQLLYHTIRMIIVSSQTISIPELREGYFKILEYLPEYMRKQFQQGWLQEAVRQFKQVLDKYNKEVHGEKFGSAKNMFALMVLDNHTPLDDLIKFALDLIQEGYLNIAIILTQVIRSDEHQQFFQRSCSQEIATEFQEALFEGHKLIAPQEVAVHIQGRPYKVMSSYLNYRYRADGILPIKKFRSRCAVWDEYNNNIVLSGVTKITNRRSKIKVVNTQDMSSRTVGEVDQEISFLDTNGEQICAFGEKKIWLYCGGRGDYKNILDVELQMQDGMSLTNLTCGRVLDQKCYMSCWCKKDGQECSRIVIQDISDLGDNQHLDVFGDPVNGQIAINCLAVSKSCPNILYTGSMYGIMTMWDLRDQDKVSLQFGSREGAHSKGVGSLDCWDNIVVSGSNDRSVRVWDVRQPQIPIADKIFDNTPVVVIKLLANLQSCSLKGIVGVCTTKNVYCASLEQESAFQDDSQIQALPLEEVDELVDFCWFTSHTNIGLHAVSKRSGIYSFNAEYKI